MSKTYSGRSEEAAAPFLDAKSWTSGMRVVGKVVRTFDTENGPCYVLDLLGTETEVNGEMVTQVSIGNLTGFRMALQAAGLDGLRLGDTVHLECTGKTSTNKGSARVNFEVEVTRE